MTLESVNKCVPNKVDKYLAYTLCQSIKILVNLSQHKVKLFDLEKGVWCDFFFMCAN